MNHKGTVRLENQRLILRRFIPEDKEAIYNNWVTEEEVVKYLTWPKHGSIEITEKVLNSWLTSYEDNSYYHWAIILKEEGEEPIGSISVANIYEKTSSVEIGYCIGSKWWGQGIMVDALKMVIKFLINEVDVSRVEAIHDVNNKASGRVMEKAGMVYEGTLRKYHRNNQGICDVCCYSVIKEDLHK